jgi:hypothetical protein
MLIKLSLHQLSIGAQSLVLLKQPREFQRLEQPLANSSISSTRMVSLNTTASTSSVTRSAPTSLALLGKQFSSEESTQSSPQTQVRACLPTIRLVAWTLAMPTTSSQLSHRHSASDNRSLTPLSIQTGVLPCLAVELTPTATITVLLSTTLSRSTARAL